MKRYSDESNSKLVNFVIIVVFLGLVGRIIFGKSFLASVPEKAPAVQSIPKAVLPPASSSQNNLETTKPVSSGSATSMLGGAFIRLRTHSR